MTPPAAQANSPSAFRVVYVVRRYPVLSQTFVTNEIAELQRQGIEVTVIALSRGADVPEFAPDIVLDEITKTKPALWWAALAFGLRHPMRLRAWLNLRRRLAGEPVPWRVLPWVARRLSASNPALFHAHFAWEGASVAWALSQLLARPWSVTVHANDMFGEPMNLEAKLANADLVVTVCEYNIRWLREEAGQTRPIAKVVCGVDLPSAVSPPVDGDPVDVIAVGRLVEKKGFDVLVRAMGILRETGQSRTCEIIGDGPLREELRLLIGSLGLGETVKLVGARPHDYVLARIPSGRVVCVPSRVARDGDRDSMPLVAKEALARAIPVVATAVGGIPEMVDDSCGRVVPPEDEAALAEALAKVLGDEATRRDLGRNGRKRVGREFTLSGEVAKLKSLFTETVSDA